MIRLQQSPSPQTSPGIAPHRRGPSHSRSRGLTWWDIRHKMPTPNNAEDRLLRDSADKATRRFRQRTEATRERDAMKCASPSFCTRSLSYLLTPRRHLQPWSDLYHPSAFPRSPFLGSADQSSLAPEPCKDTALLAFAQLVTWRLGYRRSFVSLLSTSTEYFLAEATRTMSFQYPSVTVQEDWPWIGTCAIPSTDGLASLAIGTWRTARHIREEPPKCDHYYTSGLSPHWHIISDIRQNSDCQEKVFAKHAAWARFYLTVPLRTAQGSIIGTLTVMDDRPRYGVSIEEMSFMEVSCSCSHYLVRGVGRLLLSPTSYSRS